MEGSQFKELLSTLSKNKKSDAHKADKIVDDNVEIQTTGVDKPVKKVTIKNPEAVVLKSDSTSSPHSSDAGESNVDVGEAVAVAGALTATGATANSIISGGFFDGYYTIFGFQIAKTTVFMGIVFILLLVCYYIYRAWYGKKSDKNNKRKQEVSFQEQEKSKESDETDENKDDHENDENKEDDENDEDRDDDDTDKKQNKKQLKKSKESENDE